MSKPPALPMRLDDSVIEGKLDIIPHPAERELGRFAVHNIVVFDNEALTNCPHESVTSDGIGRVVYHGECGSHEGWYAYGRGAADLEATEFEMSYGQTKPLGWRRRVTRQEKLIMITHSKTTAWFLQFLLRTLQIYMTLCKRLSKAPTEEITPPLV
jgi:hypothetical protein